MPFCFTLKIIPSRHTLSNSFDISSPSSNDLIITRIKSLLKIIKTHIQLLNKLNFPQEQLNG